MKLPSKEQCVDWADEIYGKSTWQEPALLRLKALIHRAYREGAEAMREEAAKEVSTLAKAWWSLHCSTNKHMETTRRAHEDFCKLGSTIRNLKVEE